MVSFICNACGHTVKKNKVEKHYLTECRSCSVLSCIDCGKDFHGDDYNAHNSCITEAEKYQGKLYRPKEKANKGDLKQQEWMKQVQKASDKILDPKLKQYLMKITEYSNVPRKKSKFINFCRNSLRVYDQQVLENLWEAFELQKNEEKKDDNKKADDTVEHESRKDENSNGCVNGDTEETRDIDILENGKRKRKRDKDLVIPEKKKKQKKKDKKEDNVDKEEQQLEEKNTNKESTQNDKFNWQKTIKAVIKDVGDEGIAIKKLRKKVLAAYESHGSNHKARSKEECYAVFKKKLAGYPKAKVTKEQVFYKK